jgi:hypothetical protein
MGFAGDETNDSMCSVEHSSEKAALAAAPSADDIKCYPY